MNISNYISPESEKDVKELMQPLRDATTREERDEARVKINIQGEMVDYGGWVLEGTVTN